MFVGDDTGLLKKVKLTAKRCEKEITTIYGGTRSQIKRRKLNDGEEEKVVIHRGRGALSEADN